MHRLLVILSTMFTFRPPAPGIQSSPVHIQGPALPQVPHLSHPPGKILLAKIGQSFRRFKTIRARRRRRVVLGFWADLDRLEMALQGSSKLHPDKQVCLPAPEKLWYGPLLTFRLGHQKKVTWMCPKFYRQCSEGGRFLPETLKKWFRGPVQTFLGQLLGWRVVKHEIQNPKANP